jgi:hypothetical protein
MVGSGFPPGSLRFGLPISALLIETVWARIRDSACSELGFRTEPSGPRRRGEPDGFSC